MLSKSFMREGKRSAKPAMLSCYPRYARRHYVTDYGQEKRERGAQLLHALCRVTDLRNKTGSPKSLTTYSWREPMVGT
jgi:hypothetical protein